MRERTCAALGALALLGALAVGACAEPDTPACPTEDSVNIHCRWEADNPAGSFTAYPERQVIEYDNGTQLLIESHELGTVPPTTAGDQ